MDNMFFVYYYVLLPFYCCSPYYQEASVMRASQDFLFCEIRHSFDNMYSVFIQVWI